MTENFDVTEELNNLKKENETLQNQLFQNGQGINSLMAQVEALKGELADSRTISLQLRTNFSLLQRAYAELTQLNELNQTKLNESNAKIKHLEEQKSLNTPAPIDEIQTPIKKGK